MSKKQLPSVKYLKECFAYDAEHGELIWKERPRHHFSSDSSMKRINTLFANTIAGSINTGKGCVYKRIKLFGYEYAAHRLIWVWHYGDILDDSLQIDHINRDGLDNRIENLRLVDQSTNQRNAKVRIDNSTGIAGVIPRPKGKYQVRIMTDINKRKYLGTFSDFFEACCVRKSAELKYGYKV